MILFKENILENRDLKTRDEVFNFIADHLISKKFITNKDDVINKFIARENETSTGFEEGFAIPHGKITELKEPLVVIVKTGDISWPSMDGKPTNFVFSILVPENGGNDHLKILTSISKYLAKEENRNNLQSSNADDIFIMLEEVITLKEKKKEEKTVTDGDFYVGVTKCAVGIAHTYLAAEKLEAAAKELGVTIKVETQGASGNENILTKTDIERAKGVIISADAAISGKERFNGKKVLEVPIKPALEDSKSLFSRLETATIASYEKAENNDGEEGGSDIIKAILNGVSHMIPFVVVGGLLIALSLTLGGQPTPDGLIIPQDSFWNTINQIGSFGFTLMIPILAGYIAVSIGGRAALAPVMISALVANNPDLLGTPAGTGFLGALLVGILGGYLVKYINKIPIHKTIRPIMPIFVIPIIGTLVLSLGFIWILGAPIAWITTELNQLLTFLSSNPSTQILLGIVLGGMIAVDMGGPINKTAFLFGVASITSGNPEIMGSVAAAIAVGPLAMGISTLVVPHKYNEEERGAGLAALLMGLIGISEGAIPFAAADAKRVIPSIMIGSAVSSTLALFFGITDQVPHGGPIVGALGATNHVWLYFLSILIGALISAAIVSVWKRKNIEN